MGCVPHPPEPLAPAGPRRRRVVQALAGSGALLTLPWPGPAPAASAAPAGPADPPEVALLRAGGVVVMLRHATTTPGVGDPEGFQPGVCSTQRNLSDEGREESRRIGAWFQRHGLVPAAVRSSAWCRCRDTAQLAFGRHTLWPAIDSTFGTGDSAARLPAVAQGLKQVPKGQFEVWVTHQVNITSATGATLGMGHAVIARAATGGGGAPAQVLGSLRFNS
jgi:phosphohistidine phosphatase SixA